MTHPYARDFDMTPPPDPVRTYRTFFQGAIFGAFVGCGAMLAAVVSLGAV